MLIKIFKPKIKSDVLLQQDEIDQILHKLSSLYDLNNEEKQLFEHIFGFQYSSRLIDSWIRDYADSYGVSYVKYKKKKHTLLNLYKHFDNYHKLKWLQRSIGKLQKYPQQQLKNKLLIEDTISSMIIEQEKILTYANNGLQFYRKECQFILNAKSISYITGYDRLLKFGWYHPIHNPHGLTKDHKYSVNEGYKNRIDPCLLRHPANCEFLTLRENSSKNDKCSVDLDTLKRLINKYNEDIKNI